MQSKFFFSFSGVIIQQARDRVNFLINITLAKKLLNSLNRTGLNRRKTVKLEGLTQSVKNMVLNKSFSR